MPHEGNYVPKENTHAQTFRCNCSLDGNRPGARPTHRAGATGRLPATYPFEVRRRRAQYGPADQQEVANFASHQVQRIAAAARSEPSSLTPAAKWLQHLPVGSASWHLLHSGLSASGTEEAQGIVMNLLSDEKTPGPLRETIASNLHAIEFPTIWAVRRLNDLIDGLDAACRTPALLTLGSWIGRSIRVRSERRRSPGCRTSRKAENRPPCLRLGTRDWRKPFRIWRSWPKTKGIRYVPMPCELCERFPCLTSTTSCERR